MQNQDLDRLRALLAPKGERRRSGVWRLVRKVARFIPVLRIGIRGTVRKPK